MSIPISWAKTWSSSDDGTYLHGSDLAAIQSDIATALTSAVSLNGNNTFSGTQTFTNTVTFQGSVTGVPKKVITITDGASPTFDASAGEVFRIVIAADRTMTTPTNYPSGSDASKAIIIQVKASGAGRTLTLPTATTGDFRFGATITTISQTSDGKTDYIGCLWNPTDSRWDVVSFIKGL